jgi:hypothetical protein
MTTESATAELTSVQLAHFDSFGFVVRRSLFTPAEMEQTSRDYDDVMDEDRGGKPFSGPRRQQVLGICEMRPGLMRLIDDDRIYLPIEQLLGPSPVHLGSDATLFTGSKSWHPDGAPRNEAEFGYLRIKVAFYLDPLGKDTGCLRVLPGSHKKPFHDTLMPQMTQPDGNKTPFGATAEELPAFPVETDPGDVIFFDQNTWHASIGGNIGRKQMTLNYAQDPADDAHREYLRYVDEMCLAHMRASSHTQREQLHSDELINSPRPRIQQMIAKRGWR